MVTHWRVSLGKIRWKSLFKEDKRAPINSLCLICRKKLLYIILMFTKIPIWETNHSQKNIQIIPSKCYWKNKGVPHIDLKMIWIRNLTTTQEPQRKIPPPKASWQKLFRVKKTRSKLCFQAKMQLLFTIWWVLWMSKVSLVTLAAIYPSNLQSCPSLISLSRYLPPQSPHSLNLRVHSIS